MSSRIVIGVMGAGERARDVDIELAEQLGKRIAEERWVVLTGGRDAGIMAAAVRGAKTVDGSLTIGILPTEGGAAAPGVDVPIYTGMGSARNVINVLSSRVVVTVGALTPGTASEAALALKHGRPLVLLAPDEAGAAFFAASRGELSVAASVEEAIEEIRAALPRG